MPLFHKRVCYIYTISIDRNQPDTIPKYHGYSIITLLEAATYASKNDIDVATYGSFLVDVQAFLQSEDSPANNENKADPTYKEEAFVVQDHSCCRNLSSLMKNILNMHKWIENYWNVIISNKRNAHCQILKNKKLFMIVHPYLCITHALMITNLIP